MSERTHIIAVDCDDVVFPFNNIFPLWHNQHFGTTVAYESVTNFHMPTIYGVPEEVIFTRVHDFYHSDEHALAEPLPGSVRFIETLSSKASIGLEMVTARASQYRFVTEMWLEKRFRGHFDHLHLTDMFMVGGETAARTKGEYCVEIGAKVLIEDSLSHAASAASRGVLVLMPERPWNRAAELPPGIIRCKDYAHILTELEQLKFW